MCDFDEYAERNAWVREAMDPVYLFVDPATGQGNAQALSLHAVPAGYNPNLPEYVQDDTAGCFLAFPGTTDGMYSALHLAGALQNEYPGLKCKVIKTNGPAVNL